MKMHLLQILRILPLAMVLTASGLLSGCAKNPSDVTSPSPEKQSNPSATATTTTTTSIADPAAKPPAPTVPIAEGPKPKPIKPLSKRYEKLFLSPIDIGKTYEIVEQLEGNLGDQPKAFSKFKGEYSGIRVMQSERNLLEPNWRVVDIRWVFPNEKAAEGFLKEAQTMLSEGAGPIRDVKSPGQNGRVYGGLNRGAMVLHNYFIFRQGRCVVKLYVSEGWLSKGHSTPMSVLPMAEAAARRCKNF